MNFETDGGAVGSLVLSQVAPGRRNRLWFSLDGTEACFVFDHEAPDILWIGGRSTSQVLSRSPEALRPAAARYVTMPAGHPQGFQDCFNAFVADCYAAIGGQKPDGLPRFADRRRPRRSPRLSSSPLPQGLGGRSRASKGRDSCRGGRGTRACARSIRRAHVLLHVPPRDVRMIAKGAPPMNVLAIGAHPDDVEILCAGTLAKYAAAGHKVFIGIATNGDVGSQVMSRDEIREIRHAEAKNAADVIGAELLWLGLVTSSYLTMRRYAFYSST